MSRFSEDRAAPTGTAPPPDAVVGDLDFPYVFGPDFVEALADEGGTTRVDEAFRNPPLNTEQILFPAAFLRGDDQADVDDPGVPDGETAVFRDTVGAFDA